MKTPKDYARWLHEDAGMDFEEACNMAGWSPRDDYRAAARVFGVVALVFVLIASVAWLIPAHAAEQPQLTERALINCLNQRGMIIGGELWICTPTGLRP